MRGLRRPVGEQPADVYWRRRAILLAALVVLAVIGWLVVQAIAARGDQAAAVVPDASPSPSPTVSVLAEESDQSAPTGACTGADLEIAVAPDPFTVPADGTPAFAVTVENTGPAPCVLSADGADTTLLITSGSERIWFSGDCPAETPLIGTAWLLEPGATQSVEVLWPRIRSGEGCATVSGNPRPGYYWAELTVQGVTAEAVQFELS